MQQALYKPIEEKDEPAAGEIILQAFGLHRYVSEGKRLKSFRCDMCTVCLAEAAYSCAAERDGNVIDILMRQIKFDYRIFPRWTYGANALRCGLNMKKHAHGTDTESNNFGTVSKFPEMHFQCLFR